MGRESKREIREEGEVGCVDKCRMGGGWIQRESTKEEGARGRGRVVRRRGRKRRKG